MTTKSNQETPKQQFVIQRFYIKDMSFESPSTPGIFSEDWKPDMHLDLNTSAKSLEEDTYEVILTLTVTVKSNDKVAFLVELKYAGIFLIKGFAEEDLQHTLGSFCPGTLYPYAREAVTDVVMRGGFPQLVLAPVNFEALYAQQKESDGAKNSH